MAAAADFTMPALGADMETGKVVEWRVKPGDRVRPGDVVAVVETHKGAIDVECFLDGVIADLAPLDTELPVGAVLAHVVGAGAAPAPAPTFVPAPMASPASATAPPPPLPGPAAPASAADRVRVTPAARRRAAERGVDLARLRGSAVDGAVRLADVHAAEPPTPPTPPLPSPPSPPSLPSPPTKAGFDPAAMRLAIAAAMGRSKREIPHYYLETAIDFAAAQAWLERYNAERAPDERMLPAVLLLKAAALALRRWPQLNGWYEGGAFRAGPGVHVGWAIALRGGGLVAPAIHDADTQTLPALMRALRDLVQRARSGGLRSSELTDPTVTVTSLGERGADRVFGVIYPPQVAILGFGRVRLQPVVALGQVVARPAVSLSLAADHRVSDGHLGGQALAAVDAALQTPESL